MNDNCRPAFQHTTDMSRFNAQVVSVYRAARSTRIARPLLLSRIPAGFPSPAEEYIEGRLDLNQLLIKHPISTFYLRVTGDSMIGAGIYPNDLLIVDRAYETSDGHVVVARIGSELCVKTLRISDTKVWLESENENYLPLEITEEMDFEVWGRVTASIHFH